MCLRIDAGRPIAHVAAEAGQSRRCPAKWYARWRTHGENGLLDHSSRPAISPARTAEDTREWAYVRDYASEHERHAALADFLNYHSHERPHAALGGKPPISRTSGSDYRVTFDQPPEPLDTLPRQLTFENLVEPAS